MEWGMAHGLAQDLQYDQRINDARFHNQQMQRAKAENEASLKAFEDDTDYMNASNSFDHDIIKGNANNIIKQMGAIIRENPDHASNPDVRRKLKELRVELKSNPSVIKGMASDKAISDFNDYLKEVVKNPQMHSMVEIAKRKKEQQNYLQFGHQDGKEAADKFGSQALVFERPQDWVNLNQEGLKTGALIKARKYKEYANGGNEEFVDENALHVNAMDFYKRYKNQISEEFNPKSDEEGVNYAKGIIRPGISLKREFGKPHYNDAIEFEKYKQAHGEAKASGKYDLDPFTHDIKKAEANRLNTESVQYMLGTTPQAKIYNKDGVFMKETEGLKFVPDGSFQQTKRTVGAKINKNTGAYEGIETKSHDRIGVFHGYVEMTEKELDDSGLLNDKAMKELIIPYEGKDAKNKPVTLYKIKANVHSDLNNEGMHVRYNSASKLTSKQMDNLKPLNQMNQKREIEVDTDGNMWDAETKQFLGKKQ